MNLFEERLSHYLDDESIKRLQSTKIGIAGAGGLGSNCASHLVRCGIKNIKIVDFDIVNPSNLNRQFYFLDQIGMSKVDALKINLEKINPDLELKLIKKRITANNAVKIFNDCDVVVEAFDNPESKIMIIEKLSASKKLLITVSGVGGYGKNDEIKTKKIKPNFYIIGDFTSEVNEKNPPLSPRVNIAAAKQADIVIEYILNTDTEYE